MKNVTSIKAITAKDIKNGGVKYTGKTFDAVIKPHGDGIKAVSDHKEVVFNNVTEMKKMLTESMQISTIKPAKIQNKPKVEFLTMGDSTTTYKENMPTKKPTKKTVNKKLKKVKRLMSKKSRRKNRR